MAQKETVNTFTGGMVMDTHPLTTPNNVLTNCLNGTLVTFNGNEMILQNDLGNAKIESKVNGDCVKLPEGFVPVGTAELGGIIYVSSFNPETKQCQIGCFPSPERNITSEEVGIKDNIFNYSDLINYDQNLRINNIYPLKKGFIRIDLTTTELHSGDDYTINLLSSQDINIDPDFTGCDFKLVSISDDGNIMDLNFTFGNQYYYTAPNAGKLAMLISVKKLTNFSCNYSDLQPYGGYSSTEDTNDYIEIEENPETLNEYKGNYVVQSTYDYYEQVEDSINQCHYFEKRIKNPNLTYELIENVKTYISYNNNDYIQVSGENKYQTGIITQSGNDSENNTTVVSSPYIKIKTSQGPKYKWTSQSWQVNLRCIWNDKNKEEQDYANLNGVIVNDSYYEKSQLSDSITVSGLSADQHGKIELIIYPVLKVSETLEGYSEDLKQTLILDSTLQEGDVNLTMWKYYYFDNKINLQYGFAGKLSEKNEIIKITLYAIEYKAYEHNVLPEGIEIIKIENKESYFGTFLEQLELGETLLYNKLYAIRIKIETNYSEPIYIYRWLYTNDVFNNTFNTQGVFDYDKCLLNLDNLKCNLLIGVTNDDDVIPTSKDDKDSRSIVADLEDGEIIKDYMTYGYTKNEYNVDVPISFSYDTQNELFEINSNQVISELVTVKSGDLVTPYNYTEQQDDVLNSFKGQKRESTGGKIYTGAQKYKNYTDYVEISDFTNDSLHFEGRIYNKIKGDLRTITVDGSNQFAPLVYNENTAYKYNLKYDNGKIIPIYYLCIEINPPLTVRFLGTMFKAKCTSQFKGRVSMFKTELLPGLKTRNPLSYESIDNTCSIDIDPEGNNNISIGFNSIQKNGKTLYSEFINQLKDEGISNYSIIPVLFTKLNGTMSKIGGHSGNDDRFEDTRFDVKLKIDGSEKTGQVHNSRDANNHDKSQFDVKPDSLYGTIGIFNSSESSLILLDNVIEITGLDDLSKPIFNLLSQIYQKIGSSSDKSRYCLNSYDYQQDYHAKLQISGTVKSKIKNHVILKNQYEGFDNWNINNLKIGDAELGYTTITQDFSTYKMFRVDQDLESLYKAQMYDIVGNITDSATVISCIKNIEVSKESSSDGYHILSKDNNDYKIVPLENGFSDFTLPFNTITSITQNDDRSKFICEYNLQNIQYQDIFNINNLYTSMSSVDADYDIRISYEDIDNRLNGSPFDSGTRETTGHVLTISNAIKPNKKL